MSFTGMEAKPTKSSYSQILRLYALCSLQHCSSITISIMLFPDHWGNMLLHLYKLKCVPSLILSLKLMSPAARIRADSKADAVAAWLNNAISSHHSCFRSQSSLSHVLSLSPFFFPSVVWHRAQISVCVHGRSLPNASSEWAQLPGENRRRFVKPLTHFWPGLSDSVLSAHFVEAQREFKQTEEQEVSAVFQRGVTPLFDQCITHRALICLTAVHGCFEGSLFPVSFSPRDEAKNVWVLLE